MREEQPKTTLWSLTKEILPVVTSVIVICGCLFGMLTWATGGVLPQNQYDLKSINQQLENIKNDQSREAKRQSDSQEKIINRLDAMPRPSDWAEQSAHMAALDSAVGTLSVGLAGAQHDIQNLQSNVASLNRGNNDTGFRNPSPIPRGTVH